MYYVTIVSDVFAQRNFYNYKVFVGPWRKQHKQRCGQLMMLINYGFDSCLVDGVTNYGIVFHKLKGQMRKRYHSIENVHKNKLVAFFFPFCIFVVISEFTTQGNDLQH